MIFCEFLQFLMVEIYPNSKFRGSKIAKFCKMNYTVWKFQHFSVTQILREINLEFLEVQKMAFFVVLESLNFDFWSIFSFQKVQIIVILKFIFKIFFELLESLKLISRKIWVTANFCNIHCCTKKFSNLQKKFRQIATQCGN